MKEIPSLLTELSQKKQDAAFQTFLDYPNGVRLPGIVIPQEVYQAQPLSGSQQRPSIPFVVHGRPGIRLADVLDSNRSHISGLQGAQMTPELTNNASLRITLRISVSQQPAWTYMRLTIERGFQWPGYEPWDKAIHTADHRVQLFTLSRLAHAVATAVRDFLAVSFPMPTTCGKT